ncbi:hypothetical protein ISCGN_024203 [Ixodes scapularis]
MAAPSCQRKLDTRDGTATRWKVDTCDGTATPGERTETRHASAWNDDKERAREFLLTHMKNRRNPSHKQLRCKKRHPSRRHLRVKTPYLCPVGRRKSRPTGAVHKQ